jgi:hypothetical protein
MREQPTNIHGSAVGLCGGGSPRPGAAKRLAKLVLLCLSIAVAAGLVSACGSSSSTASSTASKAPSSTTAKASSGPKPNGWGAEKSYLGRYRLLGATQQVSSGASAVKLSSGELTMFMREEHKGAPLVPSGILELHGAAPIGIELLYMTSLAHSGNVRHAVINGGSFAGPVLGSLTGVPGSGGKLTVTATVHGLGTLRASFVRFSDSPQP